MSIVDGYTYQEVKKVTTSQCKLFIKKKKRDPRLVALFVRKTVMKTEISLCIAWKTVMKTAICIAWIRI